MCDELFVPNQYKILQVFHDVTKLRFQLTDLSNPPFELNTDSTRMPWAVLAPGVSCPYLEYSITLAMMRVIIVIVIQGESLGR